MDRTTELMNELNDAGNLTAGELTAGQVLPNLPEGKEIRETTGADRYKVVSKIGAEHLVAEIDFTIPELNIGSTISVYGYYDDRFSKQLTIGRVLMFGQDVSNDSGIYQAAVNYVNDSGEYQE